MSSDHVSVAIHEMGGSGRPLLLSHATGFHGYCYLPIADQLAGKFTSYAMDYRGHGATPRPDDWAVDWERYGDDCVAAARKIAPEGGLIGFGHSMGGAGLLMAAHREPDLFDLIVTFEPIVFPTDADRPISEPSPLVEGARRRRQSFDSFEAAIENYTSKPPMSHFDSDVVRLYVGHGFRPARTPPGTYSPRSRRGSLLSPAATKWGQVRSLRASLSVCRTACTSNSRTRTTSARSSTPWAPPTSSPIWPADSINKFVRARFRRGSCQLWSTPSLRWPT
jgi:pimeloyl-ACP methyl ester carboxylesterase